MPILHQENNIFSSVDEMLERSLESFRAKVDKHIAPESGIKEDNNRRIRRTPLAAKINHINSPIRKLKASPTLIVPVATRTPKRTKLSSPITKPVLAKKIETPRKQVIQPKTECSPSTSTVSDEVKYVKTKPLASKPEVEIFNPICMFQAARPELADIHIDSFENERVGSSVPPFAKIEAVVETDDDEEHTAQKKQKKKSDWTYATSGELYDIAPVRTMRVGFQYPAEKEKFTQENTSKWFVRWADAIQVENQKDPKILQSFKVYKSTYSNTFQSLTVKRKFKLPEKRVSVKTTPTPGEERNRKVIEPVRSLAYKMDEIDIAWLDQENIVRLFDGKLEITTDEFLRIMDTFEVDCYITISRILLQQLSNSRRFFDELEHVACDICYAEECEHDDNIVFCDGCETVVHQSCYGLSEVPHDSWLCDVCLMEPEVPGCLLCPLRNGAMKKASCHTGYVHISCALWIPEVTFEDADKREIIVISKIKGNRLTAVCEVCNVVNGACLSCSEPGCVATFHVTCAQRAGYLLRMHSNEQVTFKSYCHQHTLQRLPPNTLVTNKYIRSTPMKTVKDLEKYFASYTDMDNDKLVTAFGTDVVQNVFDYWKLKRLDKGGPLILPSNISASLIPVFKEIPLKPNEIILRREPRDTRMAADNLRTLLWMTGDREAKKLESLETAEALVNNLLNSIGPEKLSDEEIDLAIDAIEELNVNPRAQLPEILEYKIPEYPVIKKDALIPLQIENYIPQGRKSTIEPITSYKPPLDEEEYEAEFYDLDFAESDNLSGSQEESSSEEDSDEEEGYALPFIAPGGPMFVGKSNFPSTLDVEENEEEPKEETVALLYNN